MDDDVERRLWSEIGAETPFPDNAGRNERDEDDDMSEREERPSVPTLPASASAVDLPKPAPLTEPLSTSHRDVVLARELSSQRVLAAKQTSHLWFAMRVGVASSTGAKAVVESQAAVTRAQHLSPDSAPLVLGGRITLWRPAAPGRVGDEARRLAAEQDAIDKALWSTLHSDSEQLEFLKQHLAVHQEHLNLLASCGHLLTTIEADLKPVAGALIHTASVSQLKRAAAHLKVEFAEGVQAEVLRPKVLSARNALARKQAECDLLTRLATNSWGLTGSSARTEAMYMGILAEPLVRKELPRILVSVGVEMQRMGRQNWFMSVSDLAEDGLRESNYSEYGVTSVDGLFVARGSDGVERAFFWENKALSGEKVLPEAEELKARHGGVVFLDVGPNPTKDDILGYQAIFGSRRDDFVQLLHHAAVTGLRGVYSQVNPTTGKLIRVVLVSFDPTFLVRHLAALHRVFSLVAPYLTDLEFPVPKMLAAGARQVTADTLSFALKCSRNMRQFLRTNPHAAQHDQKLLPHVAHFWNRHKSAVDATTRQARELYVSTGNRGVVRALFFEAFGIFVVSLCRIWNAVQVRRKIQSGVVFRSREEVMRALSAKGMRETLLDCLHEFDVAKIAVSPSRHRILPAADAAALNVRRDQNFRPGDADWIDAARTALRNVNSTSLGRADAFNSDLLLRTVRMNSAKVFPKHDKVRMPKQNCVLCCARCPDKHTKKEQGRKGHTTTNMCSECQTHLCEIPRFGSKSCFDVWHAEADLPLHVQAREGATGTPHGVAAAAAAAASSAEGDGGNLDASAREVSVMQLELALTGSSKKRRRPAQSRVDRHGQSFISKKKLFNKP